MSTQKKYSIDMTNGPLPGKILRFALPFMLGNMIQRLFNAADVVIVGKFVGDASQAAVSSTTSLINLLIDLFVGLGAGVNVVVARILGGGDRSRISGVVHTTVALGLIAGSFLILVGELFAPVMLRLMGSPEEIIGLSTVYLRVYFLGMPGELLYNFSSALLRARGDTKRPMYFLTLSGVVNVVLNVIFVVCFHWDVAGVAAATIISKYVSAGLVLWCLVRETGAMHLDLTKLRVEWDALKEIVRIGLPSGLQGCMYSLSNVTVQSAINSMGQIVVAGNGAAASLGTFINAATNAFGTSALTFAGQNLGAGKTKRVDRVIRWSLLYAIVVPTVVGLTFYATGPWLLSIYTDSPEVMEQGMLRMLMIGSMYGILGVVSVFSGTLRSMGHSTATMGITLLGTCGLRIVWVNTVFAAVGTSKSLYMCYPLTWAVTGLGLMVYFLIVRPRAYAKALAAASGKG